MGHGIGYVKYIITPLEGEVGRSNAKRKNGRVRGSYTDRL